MTTEIVSPRQTTAAARGIASGASILFAVALFASVASVGVPSDATDAELLAWWQDSGNQTATLVSMFCAITAAISFAAVANHLRTLVSVGSGPHHLARFAHVMATAYTVTLLVTAAVRGVIGYQVKVAGEPVPDVSVLRYSTSLGYTLLDNVTMTTLALSIFTLSLAILKTGVLSRWVAIGGIACAVIITAAITATVGAFAIPLALLWAVGTAIAVWRPAAA
ncbi:hypothetical protein RB614_24060 [Phytohabitans sp. ZYX-F-186]|uniref:DUF4386 family protein n=1 Tax=Phytohabitans maris TaxID=3071409 RepID=A0ABU0ZKP9_9ACTN|nr:hypothetical protein [Phytohabitans sp. ZYX-F-186]MDQ7907600.1 hypothetical protein [Phytohabitans sp. ZYX-F-186]